MSLDVTRVRIKAGWQEAPEYESERAMADGLAMVAALVGQIAEPWPPAVELGATEIAAGELAAQRSREPGARDEVVIGGLRVSPPETDPVDPLGLVRQGTVRLLRWRGGVIA